MVLKEYSKLQDLKRNLSNICKKNKKIFDIVLFGSIVKGKEILSEDIDVAVVFEGKGKFDGKVIDEVKSINKRIHITYLFLDEIYSQPLWKTILREGISLSKNKKISDILGLNAYGLYTYNIVNLGKKKSRFSQVLKGYKAESVIKKTNATLLKPGVILVPLEHVEYFRTFLERWKATYTLKYIYLQF